MGDPARQGTERLELVGREPLFLGTFALSHVAEKNRHSAAARIRVHLEPNLARGVARFEFHRHLLGHHAAIIHLEGRSIQLGKFFPKFLADDLITPAAEERLSFRVEINKFPFPIHRKKCVRRLLQDFGHSAGRLLQGDARLIAFRELPDLPLRHGKPHIQQCEIERLGEVIVRACCQRLFQIFSIIARRDEENKHLIATRLGAQLPTKLDPAFPRQHPIENQERERLHRDRLFGLFRAADRHDLVSASLDQALQIFAALLMILNQQYSHAWNFPDPKSSPNSISQGRAVAQRITILTSKMTAKMSAIRRGSSITPLLSSALRYEPPLLDTRIQFAASTHVRFPFALLLFPRTPRSTSHPRGDHDCRASRARK